MPERIADYNAIDGVAVTQAQLRVSDMVGGLMEFWGFRRPLGRIWTLLYLSHEPLTAVELADTLGMSSGAVSMAISELVKWGAVRKTWRPGERKDYFECETSIWKMITRVVRERELALIREAAEIFTDAERLLEEQVILAQRSRSSSLNRLKFLHSRLGELRALAMLGEKLVSAVVAGQSIDPTPLKDAVFKLRRVQ